MPVIAPARDRRKRHEDRLGAAVGLKAEQRAAIVDKIELDVAPAAVCLEIAFAIPVGEILAPEHDRIVRGEKMLTDALRQREAMFEAALVQIVEKNPADAARLVAMPEEKVVVAPGLESRVVVVAERHQRFATDAVKMDRVFLEAVIGREIHPAAEPPHWLRFAFTRQRGK